MKYETHENIDDEVDEDELYKIDKISLDGKEWRKRAFESKIKNIYDIKMQNGITCMHENEVNKISKCNLPHDVLHSSKRTKIQIPITILLYMDIRIQ